MDESSSRPRVVATDRLRLEPWGNPEHSEALVRLSADPEVTRFMGGPIDRLEAEELSGHLAAHWTERGWGLWAVVPLATGVPVGFAGLCHPYWQPEYAAAGGVEVAWRLERGAWGRGFATEAGRAALDEAWRSGLDAVLAFVDEKNVRSLAVAERLGMTYVATTADPHRSGERILVFVAGRPS